MKVKTYQLSFEFPLMTGLAIPLSAKAELHHSSPYFSVTNIMRAGCLSGQAILPDVKIKKISGHWVHCDSGRESDLSVAIGKAIDGNGLAA